MSLTKVISYGLKRGEPANQVKTAKPSSFDHAVPVLLEYPSPERLLCSGKTIVKIELVFPIRLSAPTPRLIVLDEYRNEEQKITFTSHQSSPSRAVWVIEDEIELNKKYLEFDISRDVTINFHVKD